MSSFFIERRIMAEPQTEQAILNAVFDSTNQQLNTTTVSATANPPDKPYNKNTVQTILNKVFENNTLRVITI